MRLMNFDESWSLLYEKVFEKDSFPPEFEQLGNQIALKCRGLPLAIVVTAGLLSKIGKALSEWQSVAENIRSVISTDVDVQCMRVLALSYHYLPHYLKPCFLYFAIFPEDKLISVEQLVELWAAEGFLKLEEMKSIEEVAEKCLKDLIDRSLISIHQSRFDGKIKSCGMHDVTRELCVREARNMNFVNVLGGKSDQNPYAQSIQFSSKSLGRMNIHNEEEMARCRNSVPLRVEVGFQCFMPELTFKLVRVLDLSFVSCPTFPSEILYLMHLRYLALRLCPCSEQYLRSEEEVPSSIIDIPPSISSLFYLQNLILNLKAHAGQQYPFILPSEVLMMPQLRHLHLVWNYLSCYEPTENSSVLKNLQCLSGWNPHYCTGSFFRLFPNLKKLQVRGVREDFCSREDLYDLDGVQEDICSSEGLYDLDGVQEDFCSLEVLYDLDDFREDFCSREDLYDLDGVREDFCSSKGLYDSDGVREDFCSRKDLYDLHGVREDFCSCKDLYDFRCLDQLEELEFGLSNPHADCFLESIAPFLFLPSPDAFPQNLKSLTFDGCFFLPWKDLSIFGKLPKLESLKLSYNACRGEEWEVAEEGFPHLKFLRLKYLDIQYWRAGSDHFPNLERLFLNGCYNLDSIPQEFADITTLSFIDIGFCQQSVGNSAKQIQQDIQDNYGGSIEVHIRDPSNLGDDDDDGSGDDDDL